jgi:Na+-transporting methylmalonyl-CoA/oxaloacetate decarboxylase gamma subunit
MASQGTKYAVLGCLLLVLGLAFVFLFVFVAAMGC